MRRHPIVQMLGIGVVAAVVGTVIALSIDWFPTQASTSADDVDRLYDALLIASVPIFVLVMTVAIYSVVKFRARPGDDRDGAPIHGNTRLEIVWVTIPFLIVTGLAIYGWVVLNDIEAKQPNELEVNVTAQQFTWSFEYPRERVRSNELVLPKDRPVHFNIRAKDVAHSFWVPEFRVKQDAVPGITTQARSTPNRTGRWQVVCAELCGIGHSTMRVFVRVVEENEFEDWLANQRRPAGGGGGPDAEQIFADQGCAGCHSLAKAGANGTVGPNLDDLARVAERREPGTSAEDYVRQSIVEPDAFTVKGFRDGVMPSDFGDKLSSGELDALVKYLLGVSGEDGGGQAE